MKITSSKKLYILFVVIALAFMFLFAYINSNKYVLDYNLQKYVEDKISEVKKMETYENGDIEFKKREISKVLDRLKYETVIKHYLYDEEGEIFSFEYKDGTLGGVMLKEFGTEFN